MPTPSTPQTYATHRRTVPVYLAVLGALTLNLAWTLWRAGQTPSLDTVMAVVVASSLVMVAFYTRSFALRVQDRVIRIEMRLRLKDALPASLQPRIGEFTKGQLVALRFASDAELPDLASQVLRDNIRDRRTIKQMVKHWQPDDLRV